MAITIAKNDITAVYAKSIVRLQGIDTATQEKYVLQIWNNDFTEKWMDVRVTPNSQDQAVVDIQNVLKSHIFENMVSIPSTWLFRNGTFDYIRYGIKYGSETNGSIDGTLTSVSGLIGYEGRRGNNATYTIYDGNPATLGYTGNNDSVIPYVSGDDSAFNCTTISTAMQAAYLTDWSKKTTGATITDGKPDFILDNDEVYVIPIYQDSQYSMSFFNRLFYGSTAPVSQVKGAEAVRITSYVGNIQVEDNYLVNTTGNGGGPNTSIGQGASIDYPYDFLTYTCGPTQIGQALGQGVTHYYMSIPLYTPEDCNAGGVAPELTNRSAWQVVRFDIIPESCNDYSHFQFRWMNSWGFPDYFTFTKKHEESIDIKRNTYYKSVTDYDNTGGTFINSGDNVFSEEATQTFTAQTRFLTDQEAQYLKNLYMSPVVQVAGLPGETQTTFVNVVVTSTNWTERTYRKDKLFQLEIQFRVHRKLNTQRG
jgi:hypothetical protein